MSGSTCGSMVARSYQRETWRAASVVSSRENDNTETGNE